MSTESTRIEEIEKKWDRKIKVDVPIFGEETDIEAVRLFPTRDVDFKCSDCKNSEKTCVKCYKLTQDFREFPKFEIDCTKERGHEPLLKVSRALRARKDNMPEIFLWFKGNNGTKNPYHFEELKYFRKDPKYWEHLGYLVLTPSQAYNLAIMLLKACKAPVDIKMKIIDSE